MTELQLWISAFEIGCFFGLVALGYYLILIGANFFNFAVGPFAMVGGLSTSFLIVKFGFPIWAAALCGIAMTIALSTATELLVVRPVQKKSAGGELPALVAVSAVLFAVQQLAGSIFGRVALPGPNILPIEPIALGPATVQGTTVLLVLAALMIFLAMSFWLQRAKTGRLLRAVGDNSEAAKVLGLPVNTLRLLAFALAGAVVAIAGILFSAKSGVSFTAGLSWTLSGFLALVIGGIGNSWAPLVGGMVVGVIQVFAPYYLGNIGPQTAILLVALLFFAFRPQGIFVRKVRA